MKPYFSKKLTFKLRGAEICNLSNLLLRYLKINIVSLLMKVDNGNSVIIKCLSLTYDMTKSLISLLKKIAFMEDFSIKKPSVTKKKFVEYAYIYI